MKRLFLILGVIAMFAMSCDKKEDLTIAVTIEGNIYDNNGNVPLSGVTVSLNSKGETYSAATNGNGYYKFEELVPGTYVLTFSLYGYGTIVELIDALADEFTGDAYTISNIAYLHKFDQTLTTKLMTSQGGVYKPASDIPLTLRLSSNYLNNKIQIVTDANGDITIDSLPDEWVTLEIDYKDNDYEYMFQFGYEISNYPKNFSEIIMLYKNTLSDMFYLTSTNIVDDEGEEVNDFTTSSDITFTFSAPIDVENSTVSLYKNYTKADVAISVSYTDGNKSISIDPLGTSLDANGSYMLTLYLDIEDGYFYYGTFNFYTGGTAEEITLGKVNKDNIEITYPTTIVATTYYVEIEFPSVENAGYYEVFGQYGTNEFLELTTLYDYGYDMISGYIYLNNLQGIVIPDEGLFANGATYSLVIRAKGSGYETGLFSDEFVISATK